MDKKLDIAIAVYSIVESSIKTDGLFLVNEQDLINSLEKFVEIEEYEKCNILNDYIKMKKFDNKKPSFFETYLDMIEKKNVLKLMLDNPDTVREKEKIKGLLKKFKKLETSFWNRLELPKRLIEITEQSSSFKKAKKKIKKKL